jgi:hypothetical protein
MGGVGGKEAKKSGIRPRLYDKRKLNHRKKMELFA